VHSSTLGNGRTVQVREALYSLQGHVAELLDKCTRKPDLDLPVTGSDLEKLQEMLVQFGDLTKVETPGRAPSWSYQNQSGRAGLERPAGVAIPPKPISPMKLEEILRSRVWDDWIMRDADIYWQTSLLEPVGGMDNFFRGFLRRPLAREAGTIEGLIRYGAKVTEIEIAADKVSVRYDDGSTHALVADYCLCTIPMPVFARLKTNLPGAYMAAAAKMPAMAAGKVGWQAQRFWETEAQIYGGISWTTDTIDQIWYPSSDYLSCIPATPNTSSAASQSAGRTWSSSAGAGSTKTIPTSVPIAPSCRARRAAFTWRATRSRSSPAGRRARSWPRIMR
jgi:monoamine oxidase